MASSPAVCPEERLIKAFNKEECEDQRASSPLAGSTPAALASHLPGCAVRLSPFLGPLPPGNTRAPTRHRQSSTRPRQTQRGPPFRVPLSRWCRWGRPNPLPQLSWSCSPGRRQASTSPGSLSGHRAVAGDTGVCPQQECKQCGKPQVPGHRSRGPLGLALALAPPGFPQSQPRGLPSTYKTPPPRRSVLPRGLTRLQTRPYRRQRAPSLQTPPSPLGHLLPAGTAAAPASSSLPSSSFKEVPLFETLPQKKGHYC